MSYLLKRFCEIKERVMEVRLVVSIDTLVDFYMENKEGEKDFEVMKTVDEQGNINSTMQDVIIRVGKE